MLVRSRWTYGSLLGLLVLAGFASEARGVANPDITFFLYTARSVGTGAPLVRPLDRWALHPGVAGIDVQVVAPGESVELTRGLHRFAAVDGTERITLRWGDRL